MAVKHIPLLSDYFTKKGDGQRDISNLNAEITDSLGSLYKNSFPPSQFAPVNYLSSINKSQAIKFNSFKGFFRQFFVKEEVSQENQDTQSDYSPSVRLVN